MRWRDRLAFRIWWRIVVAVLFVAFLAVAEGATYVNEKTKGGPVLCREGVGVIDDTRQEIVHSVLGSHPEEFKLRERCRSGTEYFWHTFREKENLISVSRCAKQLVREKHLLTNGHCPWIISKGRVCQKSLAGHSASDVESCGFPSVLNTETVFVHGWKRVISSGAKDRLV